MKTALIPARGLEGYVLRSDFHLALPIPDCMDNLDYIKTYQRAASRNDYIVLDNGAADGGLVGNDTLMDVASKLDVNEIVAPDIFYDKAGTITRVVDFMHWLTDHEYGGCYNVMAVAQGTSPTAFRKCIEAYSNMPGITVVGLPKHMLTTVNKKAARVDMANWIEESFGSRFQIHLLGTNPVWLKEVVAVSKYAPHVRSVDSALPFNYALASQNLATTKLELTRNTEYFTLDWSETASERHLNNNINTFLEWTSGTSTETPSQSELRNVSAL